VIPDEMLMAARMSETELFGRPLPIMQTLIGLYELHFHFGHVLALVDQLLVSPRHHLDVATSNGSTVVRSPLGSSYKRVPLCE
jgi:hypothetical protein